MRLALALLVVGACGSGSGPVADGATLPDAGMQPDANLACGEITSLCGIECNPHCDTFPCPPPDMCLPGCAEGHCCKCEQDPTAGTWSWTYYYVDCFCP